MDKCFDFKIPDPPDVVDLQSSEEAIPLLYFGRVVGTVTYDEDGIAHAVLDPDLISEEEVDAIFGFDPEELSFSIHVPDYYSSF